MEIVNYLFLTDRHTRAFLCMYLYIHKERQRQTRDVQKYFDTAQCSDNDNRKPGNLNSSSAFHKGLLVDD